MEIRNIQFFLLWVQTRISVKLLLLWGPSGSNLDNGLFYQINTAEHLSEAWLEKFPFVVKKMATNWLFCILCLQCHFWPALKDRQRRIKDKVSAACLLPSWTSEIGGSQVSAADRPKASEGYLSSAIQPSTPSSARRPSHCSSQGGRFVWNDILGIRRIAGEQEICLVSLTNSLEWEVQEKFQQEKNKHILSFIFSDADTFVLIGLAQGLCSLCTLAALLRLSRLIPGLFPCNIFCTTAAVMEVILRANAWWCGWMTKWDQLFITFSISSS